MNQLVSLLAAYATADNHAAMLATGMGSVWARAVARQHFERSFNENRSQNKGDKVPSYPLKMGFLAGLMPGTKQVPRCFYPAQYADFSPLRAIAALCPPTARTRAPD